MPICVCDVCGGSGKPLSTRPCICQGEGNCVAERVGLRLAVFKADKQLYQVALQARCLQKGLPDCVCIVCEIKRQIPQAVSR
jgi:hypothetical protein